MERKLVSVDLVLNEISSLKFLDFLHYFQILWPSIHLNTFFTKKQIHHTVLKLIFFFSEIRLLFKGFDYHS